MILERKDLLGDLLDTNFSKKNLDTQLKQAVSSIPCLSLTSGDFIDKNKLAINIKKFKNEKIKPDLYGPLETYAYVTNIEDIEDIEVIRPEKKYYDLIFEALYIAIDILTPNKQTLYAWYEFKSDNDNKTYIIVKKYNYFNSDKFRLVLAINEKNKNYYNKIRGMERDGDRIVQFETEIKLFQSAYENYNNKKITLGKILERNIGFLIEKGDEEKSSNTGDFSLSDIKEGCKNEFLKVAQNAGLSSYEWEVKCNYTEINKKTKSETKKERILNTSFEDVISKLGQIKSCEIFYKNDNEFKEYKNFSDIYNKINTFNEEDAKPGDTLIRVKIIPTSDNTTKRLFVKKNQYVNSKVDLLEVLKGTSIYEKINSYDGNEIIMNREPKDVVKLGGNIETYDGSTSYNANKLFVYGCKSEQDNNVKGILEEWKCEFKYNEGYIIKDASKEVLDELKKYYYDNDNDKVQYKKYLKIKSNVFCKTITRVFNNKIKSVYGNKNISNIEETDYAGFLNVVLAITILEDSNSIPKSIMDKLNLKSSDSGRAINEKYKNALESEIGNLYQYSEEISEFDFGKVSKLNAFGMLLNEIKKIEDTPKEIKNIDIDDIVITAVCKAKRNLKVYSISGYHYGGVYKLNSKEYRFATLIPNNEPVQEISENDYEGISIQQVEDFIQSWMVRPEKQSEGKQYFVPIEGYYDMLNGMTPYVEFSFRQGLGSLSYDGNGNIVLTKENSSDKEIYKEKLNDGKRTGVFYKQKLDENNNYVDEGESITYRELKQKVVNSFKKMNSIQYPYFESLSITDNGVKEITLILKDPDFGSLTLDPVDKTVFSLESVIRESLKNPFYNQEAAEDNSSYDNSIDYSEGIKDGYLDIKEAAVSYSPTNLKLRFGYVDNSNIKQNKNFNFKDPSTDAFNGRFEDTTGRDYRWWNVSNIGSNSNINVKEIKKWVKNDEIQNQNGDYISINDNINNPDYEEPKNSNNENISFNSMLRSPFQTTSVSREYCFMIIGFETEFTEEGLIYRIKAIESKDSVTMKTRFLQRYAELTANPEEVLYNLMHIFNEDNDGHNISSSRVKICLVEDVDDNYMKDILNMKYDFKKMKNEKLINSEAETEDLYTAACFGKGIVYNPKYLKDITIKFGSEDAVRNYNNSTERNFKDNPPLYKSVAQLMNEFCASCPPKIEKKWKDVADENGNKIISDNGNYSARPLKWFTFEDINNNIVYICLYYRSVKKIDRIRQYTWGPNNPIQSCVKSVNIKNSNEFAVLSAVDAFKTNDGIIPRNACISVGGSIELNKDKKIKTPVGYTGDSTNIAGSKAENYLNAFSSSMYNVNMGILGDPSLCFDGDLQPYTYPIKLDLLMPQNEFTRRIIAGERSDEMTKEAANKILKNMPRLTDIYTGSAWYERENKNVVGKGGGVDNNGDHYTEVLYNNDKANQMLHEASGFYVISKIVHEITKNEFNTNLELVSYPNIEKDVIKGVRD